MNGEEPGGDPELSQLAVRWPGWSFSRDGDRLVARKGSEWLEAGNARDLDVLVYRRPFEQDAAEDAAREEGGHWPSAG